MPETPYAALERLLLELCDPQKLHQMLSHQDWAVQIVPELLPAEHAKPVHWMHHTVTTLRRHNVIQPLLFELLRAEYPRQLERIQATEARFSPRYPARRGARHLAMGGLVLVAVGLIPLPQPKTPDQTLNDWIAARALAEEQGWVVVEGRGTGPALNDLVTPPSQGGPRGLAITPCGDNAPPIGHSERLSLREPAGESGPFAVVVERRVIASQADLTERCHAELSRRIHAGEDVAHVQGVIEQLVVVATLTPPSRVASLLLLPRSPRQGGLFVSEEAAGWVLAFRAAALRWG